MAALPATLPPAQRLMDVQAAVARESEPPWVAEMRQVVGADALMTGFAQRLAYSRDRMPATSYMLRDGYLPRELPQAIAVPGSDAELAALITIANRHQVPVVPYGAGSGVLGGAVPLASGLTVDLKAFNRIIEINRVNNTVTVEAGMNGGTFEAVLNAEGFTTGHLPQSLTMSTVGGWAACRGGGQFSSRYGKIEDMVIGLRAVLGNGQTVTVDPLARRATGPAIKDILVGSEGVYGFITRLTLRLWPLPEHEIAAVYAFPDHEAGLSALRAVMQAELRPTMARLYDATESRPRAGHLEGFEDGRALCMMIFSGLPALAETEHKLAHDICMAHGAAVLPEDPVTHWRGVRYRSYSNEYMFDGAFMDTVEITGGWDVLPEMYRTMRDGLRALHPEAYFGAHWSHVYPEGACQYMTFRFPKMALEEARLLHAQAWDVLQSRCLDLKGTISHHHGSGYWRNPWLMRELNAGLGLMEAIKSWADPNGLMNGGKLGLEGSGATTGGETT